MCIGGVSSETTTIDSCYNEGNIYYEKNNCAKDNIYIGGITGKNSSPITNSYNTGNIIGNKVDETKAGMILNIGGIAGTAGSIKNCYNTGNIYDPVSEYNNPKSYYYVNYLGPIYGTTSNGESNYYPDSIEITGFTENVNNAYCTKTTEESMKTKEFCDALREDCDKWLYVENGFPILDIAVINSTSEVTELTIGNEKKSFDITTEVGENSSGNRDGGTITGKNNNIYAEEHNIKYVETVEYGESNTNKIDIEPTEGYMIQKITINDKELPFKADNEGKVELESGYFDKVTSKVHIIAYFVKKNSSITINKTGEDGDKLAGAKFRIESESISEGNILGNLTQNGIYHFEKDNNGYIVPDNIGVAGTVASSYYKLDLTNETQPMQVVIHAYNNYQKGTLYATITENTNVPESDSVKNFLQTNENNSNSFVSETLQPGKVYYLHLGFDCAETNFSKEVYIESIKVLYMNDQEDGVVLEPKNSDGVDLEETENSYTFRDIQSESQFICIPIDLQDKKGNYEVELDATLNNVSIWGMVTQDEANNPALDNKQTCIYCEKNVNNKCFATKVLEGGKKYYLYISYTAAGDSDVGGELTLKNIKLKKIYDCLIYETNENGQIVIQVPKGTYKITEIQAPEGYELNTESKECEVKGEEDSENCVIDVGDQKLREVVIHYYLKDSNKDNMNYGATQTSQPTSEISSIAVENKSVLQKTKNYINNALESDNMINKIIQQINNQPISLKEEVHLYGIFGEDYDTSNYIETELQGYTLEVNENNEYVIPQNATGTFDEDVIHVNYYYEKTSDKLTSISLNKKWNLPDEILNDYKATIRLVKVENNRSIPVYDNNGDEITREIRGNGTAIIENLLQYDEDGTEIEYGVEEIKVEKVKSINEETQEEIWEVVPLEQFKATYKIKEKE